MRLNSGWSKECWQSCVVALGLCHFVISLYLVQLIASIENGVDALEKGNKQREFLWTKKNESWNELQTDNGKQIEKNKKKNIIHNEHIRWKWKNRTNKRIRKEYKFNSTNQNIESDSAAVPFTEKREMELMKFVNSGEDRNEQIKITDYSINNNGKILSHSWAIKLPMNSYSNLDEELLHSTADRLAVEHGLINFGPIGGLKGHYYFVHRNFFHDLETDHSNDSMKGNVTKFLKSHPEIEWVQHEPIQIRKKRALEFKDQFFPSQWHLVRQLN